MTSFTSRKSFEREEWPFKTSLLSDRFFTRKFESSFDDDFFNGYRHKNGLFHRFNNNNGEVSITNDARKLEIILDVGPFNAEDIEVKTDDNKIIIRLRHEERKEDEGLVSREITRKYDLPQTCKPEHVTAFLSSRGVLTIDAPKKAKEENSQSVRIIPISVKKEETVETTKTETMKTETKKTTPKTTTGLLSSKV